MRSPLADVLSQRRRALPMRSRRSSTFPSQRRRALPMRSLRSCGAFSAGRSHFGSSSGTAAASVRPMGSGTFHVRSVDALRRVFWAPGELGFARAYVAGDIDLEGDLVAILRSLQLVAKRDLRVGLRAVPAAVTSAYRAGAIGLPLPAPREEARVVGLRHSRRRDVRAVTHHYDVGNEFYRPCARGEHDVLMRPFCRSGDESGAGPGGQARADLPQAGIGRRPTPPTAGRRLRLGFHGDARRGAPTTRGSWASP